MHCFTVSLQQGVAMKGRSSSVRDLVALAAQIPRQKPPRSEEGGEEVDPNDAANISGYCSNPEGGVRLYMRSCVLGCLCCGIVARAARLAQSVEHETLNLRVVGSSPTLGEHFVFSFSPTTRLYYL